MELNEWQNQVDAAARELCLKLFEFGESMDLNPEIAMAALPHAAAQCVVALLIGEDEPRVLDDVAKCHIEDFDLSLRKELAHSAPDRVSDAFKLETGRIDRELKRRRQMPNAPAPGEA